jgi:EAL domain-containing protein (putative c-di-GMP-specific phosphodiesterase class I)
MLDTSLGVEHLGVGHMDRGSPLEADLAKGLRNDEFALHYQPICSSRSGHVVGVEALLRWSSERNGPVGPSTFIPLAERTGLIHDLGRWVLEAACTQLAKWDREGLVFPFVSVNVSPEQLQDPAFVHYVIETITANRIAASRIELEITEGLRIHDMGRIKTGRGIRIVVDDFGTGYSGLTYLQSLPLSKLKIDRTFIANLPSSRNDAAIVSALVGLARSLDLELVAEGVENEAQRAMLAELGCDYVQGWLNCKPVPADELTRRFAAHTLRMAGQGRSRISSPLPAALSPSLHFERRRTG